MSPYYPSSCHSYPTQIVHQLINQSTQLVTPGSMLGQDSTPARSTIAHSLLRELVADDDEPSDNELDFMAGYNVEAKEDEMIIRIPRNRQARRARAQAQAQNLQVNIPHRAIGPPSATSSADAAAASDIAALVPGSTATRSIDVELVQHRVTVTETDVQSAHDRLQAAMGEEDAPPYRSRSGTPALPSTPHQLAAPVPAPAIVNFGEEGQGEEPLYSAMAIDPRTGDASGASWPHALPDRETGSNSNTGNSTPHDVSNAVGNASNNVEFDHAKYLQQLQQFQAENNPPAPAQAQLPPVQPVRNLHGLAIPAPPSAVPHVQIQTPTTVSGLARGLVIPSAPPSRRTVMPAVKACHNFLLAQRVDNHEKKSVRDHNLMMFVMAQNEGKRLAFMPDANYRPGYMPRPSIAGPSIAGPSSQNAQVQGQGQIQPCPSNDQYVQGVAPAQQNVQYQQVAGARRLVPVRRLVQLQVVQPQQYVTVPWHAATAPVYDYQQVGHQAQQQPMMMPFQRVLVNNPPPYAPQQSMQYVQPLPAQQEQVPAQAAPYVEAHTGNAAQQPVAGASPASTDVEMAEDTGRKRKSAPPTNVIASSSTAEGSRPPVKRRRNGSTKTTVENADDEGEEGNKSGPRGRKANKKDPKK